MFIFINCLSSYPNKIYECLPFLIKWNCVIIFILLLSALTGSQAQRWMCVDCVIHLKEVADNKYWAKILKEGSKCLVAFELKKSYIKVLLTTLTTTSLLYFPKFKFKGKYFLHNQIYVKLIPIFAQNISLSSASLLVCLCISMILTSLSIHPSIFSN